jgi:acyl dehydratase
MPIDETVSWTRTFHEGDVRAFSLVSGDEGRQHVVPDEHGRLMVQGLLTATLPSKIGGDMSFLARQMTFHFHRPVFVGDTIRCEVKIDQLDGPPGRLRLSCSWICTNQEGTTVMTGGSEGVVLPSSSPGDPSSRE